MSLRPKDMALQATSHAHSLAITSAAVTEEEVVEVTEQLQLMPKASDEVACLNPKGTSQARRRPKHNRRLQQERTYNLGLAILRLVSTEQESSLIDESGNEQKVPARRNRFDLRVPQWFLSRGFSWESFSIYSGWQYSFRTFRYIPHDSLIVDFCTQGDLANVQKLFAKGLASPFDRVRRENDDWSLLHVSAVILPTQRQLLTSYHDSSIPPSAPKRSFVNS